MIKDMYSKPACAPFLKRAGAGLLLFLAMEASAGSFTKFVDPFIGTGAVDGGLSGNNYPGATVPFGMVQLSPDTNEAPDWYDACGYNYTRDKIYGFSHTRLSGTGAADLIDVTYFPTTTDRTNSPFDRVRESAAPGYYRVKLTDENIDVELSSTKRVGIQRITWLAGDRRNLWIDMDHSAVKGSWDRKIIASQITQVSSTAVEGWRVITGWAKLRKVYFHAEFSEPLTKIKGDDLKTLFSVGGSKSLIVRTAISNVSCENARENMRAEASHSDFDRYVADADKAWDKELGKIEVSGGTADDKKIFYTAIYHAMQQPNVFSDVNGEFTAADYTIKKAPKGENVYTTFSLWDTYRAAHPFYTMLYPAETRDFVNSMLAHYDAIGYLPIWHLWGQDNYCMIGNHAIPVIVDAVLKGIPGIDAEHAWRAVRASSTKSHINAPFEVWEKHGYMPENVQTQSVSITLEMAYDDWCVAQLAKHLGKAAEAEHFQKRAQFYRNLYNPAKGFFAPKDDKGEWIEPFDPLKHGANGGNPFTEGNAWQYLWYVPQDIPGLISLIGGNKAFEKKLDTFFTLTETSGAKNDNISGEIGQYAHGNEPSHHVAYLYNACGAPHKAQEYIHRIKHEMYNTTSSGYAGNDDCGEMSIWYVFSALGFYPVNPASGVYDLGTPTFDRAVIHLPSGKDFTVTAKRKRQTACKVSAVKLNGKRISGYTVAHADIMAGGTLEFVMQ